MAKRKSKCVVFQKVKTEQGEAWAIVETGELASTAEAKKWIIANAKEKIVYRTGSLSDSDMQVKTEIKKKIV